MRAGLYARVSTGEQVTTDAQLAALRSYCEARSWTVALELEEVGSGAKARPKREQLLKLCRQRKLDAVLVWKLDRWGRSTADLVTTLDELTTLGVVFVSLTEAIDLSTAIGQLTARLMAAFAQFERDLMKERIRFGIGRARQKGTKSGKAIGRPATPRETADRVRELLAEGRPVRSIAAELKIGRASVGRIRDAGREGGDFTTEPTESTEGKKGN